MKHIPALLALALLMFILPYASKAKTSSHHQRHIVNNSSQMVTYVSSVADNLKKLNEQMAAFLPLVNDPKRDDDGWKFQISGCMLAIKSCCQQGITIQGPPSAINIQGEHRKGMNAIIYAMDHFPKAIDDNDKNEFDDCAEHVGESQKYVMLAMQEVKKLR